jgi:hypothetical protein
MAQPRGLRKAALLNDTFVTRRQNPEQMAMASQRARESALEAAAIATGAAAEVPPTAAITQQSKAKKSGVKQRLPRRATLVLWAAEPHQRPHSHLAKRKIQEVLATQASIAETSLRQIYKISPFFRA